MIVMPGPPKLVWRRKRPCMSTETPKCLGNDQTISWNQQSIQGVPGVNANTILNGRGAKRKPW
jgi:hypothetical protein